MTRADETLARIDSVIDQNKRIENIFIGFSIILFLCGIACFISAIITGKYVWSSPSFVTTSLLYFPIKEIKKIRQYNIALASAPALIKKLPPELAALEIQKLIQRLFEQS
jgi:hypothetical protein